jgi:hypothetical protein
MVLPRSTAALTVEDFNRAINSLDFGSERNMRGGFDFNNRRLGAVLLAQAFGVIVVDGPVDGIQGAAAYIRAGRAEGIRDTLLALGDVTLERFNEEVAKLRAILAAPSLREPADLGRDIDNYNNGIPSKHDAFSALCRHINPDCITVCGRPIEGVEKARYDEERGALRWADIDSDIRRRVKGALQRIQSSEALTEENFKAECAGIGLMFYQEHDRSGE